MRAAAIGAFLGAGLVVAVVGGLAGSSEVLAERRAIGGADASSGMIAFSGPAGPNGQLITLIDPETRVMSVYRVDSATGEIALKSVRNIHWDLQMVDFNGVSPLPREVRALVEQH